MKKYVLLALIAATSQLALGCQVIFLNDSGQKVIITDLQDGKTKNVAAGDKINANTDPNTHARIKVVINPSGPSKSTYLVKQIACSESHEIPLSASQIKEGTYDSKLLKIKGKRFMHDPLAMFK